MKPLLSAVLCLIISLAICQDSLVSLTKVRYNSEYEEVTFKKYFYDQNNDYISLFLGLNASVNEANANQIEAKIEKVISEIRSTNYESKKPQKQIKAIYQKIHDTFFKKYEMENRFHEIFETGNYNCVTATALYSIIFDRLNIPYVIKEEPTHVYLVAYPNESNIMVETTTPAYGYMNYDQAYKNNFLKALKDQKIIGKDEFDSNNTEQLFNKYYFSNENIDLKKLIGIHYMNDAIFLQAKGKKKESFEQAEKAYLFYPSEKSQHLIASFGAILISTTDMDPLEKSELVVKLSRFKSMGITNEMIKGEFMGIAQEVLLKQNDKNLFKKCYSIFSNELEDKDLIADISYYYNFETGRIYYNQGDFNNARNHFKKSLEIQPSNVDLGLVFSQCLSQTFSTIESNTTVVDTIVYYKNNFPSLMDIQIFKVMLAKAYLFEFQNMYNTGKPAQGDKYKDLFESLVNVDNKIYVNHDIIGLAYSTACTYYFKKGQKSKAKELVSKGLEYAPGSYELRIRQQMLAR